MEAEPDEIKRLALNEDGGDYAARARYGCHRVAASSPRKHHGRQSTDSGNAQDRRHLGRRVVGSGLSLG
jgi:hypothetical protein